MMTYKQGDIVLLAKFPQTNLEKTIKRPAFVLADFGDEDIVLAKVTSVFHKSKFDYEIEDWKSCGLLLPSEIRLGKIATLQKKFIYKKLGGLLKGEIEQVKKIIKMVFNLNNKEG